MSVTRGQCDARPTVTFPTARHHRPLAGTKLYCLVTAWHVCWQLAQGCTRQLEFKPMTYWSQVRHPTATPPSHRPWLQWNPEWKHLVPVYLGWIGKWPLHECRRCSGTWLLTIITLVINRHGELASECFRGRPQVSLAWASPWNVIFFPFSALTLLLGRQKGHPACKKLGVGLLIVTIWLELCTYQSSSCHHHFHHP